MSLSSIRNLVTMFEQTANEQTPVSTKRESVRVISQPRLDLPQTKLEEESTKHLFTQTKLDNSNSKLKAAEKEIADLRKEKERLQQKLNKLALLFNDFKGIMEDDTYLNIIPRSNPRKSVDIRGNGTHISFFTPPVQTPPSTVAPIIDSTPQNLSVTIPVSSVTTPSITTPQPASIPSSTSSDSIAYESDSSDSSTVPPSPSRSGSTDSIPGSASPNPTKERPQVPRRITYNTHLNSTNVPHIAATSSATSSTPVSAPLTPTLTSISASLSTISNSMVSTSAAIPVIVDPNRFSTGLPKPKHLDLHDHTIEIFLKTQISYCANLQLIVEIFLQPLRDEVRNSTDPFISQQNVQQIFSHIEVISGLAKLLVQMLEVRVDKGPRPLVIGDIFLQASDYFKLYTPYISNYSQAFTTLNTCKAESPRFSAFIRDRERKIESKFKDLGSLLVLPVMRISQYSNFLEEVLENTPEDMPDCVPLQEALKKMKSVVEYVKEKTLDYESQNKVQQVQSMLTGKFANLNAPHRRYIMEGILLELTTNREYHCFLFNVIARQKKKQLEHRSTIDLCHMDVDIAQDESGRPLFSVSPASSAPSTAGLLYSPIAQTSSLRDVPNIFSNLSASPTLSSSGSNLPTTNLANSTTISSSSPYLLFCASSIRDRDSWVLSLTECIEQEKAAEKTKPKPVTQQKEQPIGSGGVFDYEKSNVELQELIAQGGSGCKIHRCTVDGYTCTAKVLNVEGRSQEMVAPFVREIMIIEQLRHQNIIKYLGHRFTKNNNRMWLFMEYCPFSLEKILARRRGVLFPPKDVAWMALEIAKGIEFLHSQSIIHRDLKCGNILCNLDENNEVKSLKITDFDTSKIVTNKTMQLHTCIGTTAFMAPEVLDVQNATQGYSFKADVFSFGMLLVEIISLQPPYSKHESIRVAELILTSKKPELPDLPPEMANMIKFIDQCLAFEPEQRPSSSQAVTALTKILKDLTTGTQKK